jgi:hypothetical protein
MITEDPGRDCIKRYKSNNKKRKPFVEKLDIDEKKKKDLLLNYYPGTENDTFTGTRTDTLTHTASAEFREADTVDMDTEDTAALPYSSGRGRGGTSGLATTIHLGLLVFLTVIHQGKLSGDTRPLSFTSLCDNSP